MDIKFNFALTAADRCQVHLRAYFDGHRLRISTAERWLVRAGTLRRQGRRRYTLASVAPAGFHEAAHPMLVLPLVSQAPVQQVDGVPVPKLEKLLVDVFAEPVRLAAYQGAELGRVFSGAARQVPLVPATLWRYAQRRKRADALREWLRLRADEPALRELADWPAQR